MTETKVEVSDEPKEVEKKPEVDSTNVKKEEEEVKNEVENVKEDEKVIEKEDEKEIEKEKEEEKKVDEEIKKEKEEEISGDLSEVENKIIRQIKVCFFNHAWLCWNLQFSNKIKFIVISSIYNHITSHLKS